MSGVNSTIKKTQTSLKDVNKLLKLDPTNTELLTQKQRLLKDAIASTKEKLDALKTAQEQAKVQLESGDLGQDKYDALEREIAETEAELKKLEKQASDSAVKLQALGTSLQQTGEKMAGIGNGMKTVGSTLTKTVTAPLLGVAAAAVKVGTDFDSEMSKVAAISGATGDDLQSLRDTAIEWGSKTKFSATEAAEGLEYMALAGWNTQDSISALPSVLNLAAAADMDLGEASDIVTDYLTAFGLSADDASTFVDQLAFAMANSNTDVTMLGEAFKNCAATAGSMGYSVEDVTAALMTMADAGIKGGEAGTALNTIMTRLATDTKGCATELKQYGIEVYDTEGNMNSLSSILNGMITIWSDLTDEQQANLSKTIAGTNQYSSFQTIMQGLSDTAVETGKSFNDYSAALADCEGTAEKMAATMQDNLAGQLTTLKSTLETIGIQISTILTPALSQIVTWLQNAATAFANLDEGTKKVIITIAAIAAAIGPIIAVIGTVVSAIGAAMTAVGGLMTAMAAGEGVVVALGGALGALAGPIAIVVALIAGIAIAVVTHWDTIKGVIAGIGSAVSELVASIGTWLSGIISSIASFISNIVSTVSGVFTTIGNIVKVGLMLIAEIFNAYITIITLPFQFIWENCKDILISAWQAITEKISSALADISTAVSSGLNAVKAIFTNVWNAIRSVVSTVLNAIKAVITSVWNAVRSVTSSVWNAIKSVITSVVNSIKSTVTSVFNAIKTAITTPLNAAKASVSSIFNGIKTTISNTINNAKSVVTNGLNAIKAAFSRLTLKFPSINLPHFSISGSFSLNPPSVPHFSVSWYSKAMDSAMLLKNPTIFGMTGGRFLGGGEVGNEFVTGQRNLEDSIRTQVSDVMADVMTEVSERLDTLIAQVAAGKNIYLDKNKWVGATAGAYNSALGEEADRANWGY
ncbi:MAG: phage tail tape measure protein [Butyricicoccus sp.]